MTKELNENKKDEKKICGIIMPIIPQPGYADDHWNDVLSILIEAINETSFEAKLVSDDIAIGLIHDRIIKNIYTNEMVVCDVSSKNPNVMFELGLRLAFDKPTIIIKDEVTSYSFDTGVIEHISYPSSLSFKEIIKFKEELSKRINGTYSKAIKEPHYSPFLKSFGKNIISATIQQTDIPEGKYITDQLQELRQELRIMRIDQKSIFEKAVMELHNSRSVDSDRINSYNVERVTYSQEIEKLKKMNDALAKESEFLRIKLQDKN